MNKKSYSLIIITFILLISTIILSCNMNTNPLQPSYFVIYDGNGSTGGQPPLDLISYEAGKPVTVRNNSGVLVKTGSTFNGWNTSPDGTGVSYSPGDAFIMPISNTILYAQWTNYCYYVIYSTDSGSTDYEIQTVRSPGRSISSLPSDPNKDNYYFGGWYTEPDRKGVEFTSGTEVSGNMTVYAWWSADPIYTVSFDSNNETGIETMKLIENELIPEPVIPVNEGFFFGGWYSDEELTTPWDFDSDSVSANLTLYVKWLDNSVYCIVTFETGEGSSLSPQYTLYNNVMQKPSSPAYEGYNFNGWYADEERSIPWDFDNNIIIQDTTLYAGWIIPTPKECFSYTISEGVIIIDDFDESATEIIIPETIDGIPVTSIADYAFEGCTSLTSIDLPDSLTSIGREAFLGCTSLTSIDLPDSLTSIAYMAFSHCTSLTTIDFPDSLTSIAESAFYNCTSLTSIDFPDSLTSIGLFSFENCTSLTSIDFPDSLTSIGSVAFYNCTSLTTIDFPDSLTSIASSAFANCARLTTIDFPDSLTSIEPAAFWGCVSLATIDLPDSLISIEGEAFIDCWNLTSVYINRTIPPNLGHEVFTGTPATKIFYIPASADHSILGLYTGGTYPNWPTDPARYSEYEF